MNCGAVNHRVFKHELSAQVFKEYGIMITPIMKAMAPVTSQNCEPLMALPGSMFAPCSSHISPNIAIIAPIIEKA